MLEFFRRLFESGGFMPHGYCINRPELIGLHVVSDALIALAYYAIPFTLLYIIRRRGDLAYPWMYLLFCVFILSCGTTHLMAVIVQWNPVYRLDGLIKAVTALASVPTAIVLIAITPKILAIPSPEQLRRAHAEILRLNEELEQRVAERTRELRESEARLNAILDQSPTAVYMKDLEGRLQFVNRGYELMTGLKREEVLQRTDADLFPQHLASEFLVHDRRVLETGEPTEFEERLEAGGERMTVLTVKFPLTGDSGRPYALCGISLDITHRKAAELALRRYTAELEDFAHVASHDLQEPLRGIKSYTQLLARRYRGRLDEDADEFIGYITSGVERMAEVIQGLLEYSRLVHSPTESVAGVDADRALDRALATLDRSITEQGATVSRERLPRVVADESRLVSVFQNLISNAIKYRHPDRPPVIRIWSAAHEEWCTISVEDNGIGIEAEYQDRVFALFRRLHGREIHGTGVGLTITRKIVEAHGGRIWIESDGRSGTTFHFTLPRAEPAPDAKI